MNVRIAVVGGGIGGLAVAALLRRAGSRAGAAALRNGWTYGYDAEAGLEYATQP